MNKPSNNCWCKLTPFAARQVSILVEHSQASPWKSGLQMHLLLLVLSSQTQVPRCSPEIYHRNILIKSVENMVDIVRKYKCISVADLTGIWTSLQWFAKVNWNFSAHTYTCIHFIHTNNWTCKCLLAGDKTKFKKKNLKKMYLLNFCLLWNKNNNSKCMFLTST